MELNSKVGFLGVKEPSRELKKRGSADLGQPGRSNAHVSTIERLNGQEMKGSTESGTFETTSTLDRTGREGE
jgi:hypothetical protein